MRQIIAVIVLIGVLIYADNTTYYWPIPNGDKKIISNLGDYRPLGSPPHIHEGNDIPATTEDVWTITVNFRVEAIGHNGIGYIVRVQNYSDSANMLSEGSVYMHMDSIESDIYVDSFYCGDYLSVQTTFHENHLHLEYRRPHAFSSANSINPLTLAVLGVNDTIAPILNHLYVDCCRHGNANIENLNFLNYQFDSWYGDTTGGGFTYIKLDLPNETPDDDLDDPHIIISGNRKVKFVLDGQDDFFKKNDDRGAPMELSLYLFDVDSTGVIQKSYYTFIFDSLIGGTEEYHEEEDIYHVTPPLMSDISAPQYYLLYPFDSMGNGLPGSIRTDSTTALKTENLEEGLYRMRIFAKDYYNNTKTADVHFYIKNDSTAWVDFCRGFKE